MCLLIVLLIGSSIAAEEKLSITISSGAFFNEIPEVMVYEKSIPLIYTQKIITEEQHFVENLIEIENYCENEKNNYCYTIQQTLILLKNLNTNINDNKKNLEKTEEMVGNNRKKTNRKRGIQIIGDFYNFCCDVATEKQIKNFYTNEDKLKQQADRLKDVFVSDHKDLNQITSQLNNYTTVTSNKLEILKNSFKTLLNEEKKNDLIETTKTDKEIKGLQDITFSLITMIIKIMNYERETSTQLHCKISKIPSRLITIDTLHTDLIKLSDIIKKNGFELAINLDNLSLYYNIPITECQFSKTQVLIKIKIPIRELKSNWKLFQYIPAHFKYKNSTCIIYSEKNIYGS